MRKFFRISTHTPLARRDFVPNRIVWDHWISTHTPLARRDYNAYHRGHLSPNFYSHASCEARREFDVETGVITSNFYSHASCEARLILTDHSLNRLQFLLTRLLRGATATYSIRNSRTSYIQEADSKIITKYSIKFNILHDPAIKSRRTCLSFMHHNTFACYSP